MTKRLLLACLMLASLLVLGVAQAAAETDPSASAVVQTDGPPPDDTMCPLDPETNDCLPPTYACYDGADNDGDGLVDYGGDPGCSAPTDQDEWHYIPPPVVNACGDAGDNDGDGLIDMNDPGCSSPSDNDEWNAPPPPPPVLPKCLNGLDDDGDGLYDFPSDPGCASTSDNDEYNAPPPPPPPIVTDIYAYEKWNSTYDTAMSFYAIAGETPINNPVNRCAVKSRIFKGVSGIYGSIHAQFDNLCRFRPVSLVNTACLVRYRSRHLDGKTIIECHAVQAIEKRFLRLQFHHQCDYTTVEHLWRTEGFGEVVTGDVRQPYFSSPKTNTPDYYMKCI